MINLGGGRMETKNDFKQGSVAINIIKLAVPMTVAQLINVLYSVVDRIYIGRMPEEGQVALTGLGLTFPIITIVIAFANLVGMGGAPLSSIERGKGNNEVAEKVIGNSFTMLLGLGILLTLIGLLVKKPVLYLFGASEITFPNADSYARIYLLGTAFVMLGLGLNSYINAQGFAKVGMLSVILGAVINLVLDPIFIYLFKMGVEGAAWATVISQGCSCIWILRFLTGPQTILKLKTKNMKLEQAIVTRILGLGSSGFAMAITNSSVQIVCNATLSLFGGDLYVGAMTVINSIREVIMMPVQGLTNGAMPVISYNYGAKAYKRVKKGIEFSTLICILYTTFAWAMIYFFGSFFIKIFNNEAKLVRIANPALMVYFFGFFMMSFQFAGQSTFVALGKSKQAVFFSIFRKVIIVVPLTLLLPRIGYGVMGVFIAEPVSNFIGGMACYITMLLLLRKELKGKQDMQVFS